MANVGKNFAGVDQNLILEREVGKFKTKKEAINSAHENEGSELIYRDKSNIWTVKEIKEEGVLYGSDPLTAEDKDEIELVLKTAIPSVKEAMISFVENEEQVYVRDTEKEWSEALEKKVKSGYKPSDAEAKKYKSINNKPIVVPKSKNNEAEFAWATQIEKKIQSGYKPTESEVQKYNSITGKNLKIKK